MTTKQVDIGEDYHRIGYVLYHLADERRAGQWLRSWMSQSTRYSLHRKGSTSCRSAEIGDGETTPMAPLVAKGKVFVGPSGGEFGIHGWLKGFDLATGKVLWTA